MMSFNCIIIVIAENWASLLPTILQFYKTGVCLHSRSHINAHQVFVLYMLIDALFYLKDTLDQSIYYIVVVLLVQ